MGEGFTTGVHWLTAAVPGRALAEVSHCVGGLHKARGGGMGHPDRYVHESGARIYAGSPRDDQPIVVDVPGETCEGWAATWLEMLSDLGCYLTRVDVAGDLEPADAARRRLLQLRREFSGGRVETRMKRASMSWMQNDEGGTLYLGGKTAEHRVRCYDRRGPLRIEHQWRPGDKTQGRFVVEVLLKHGAGPVWRSLSSRVKFPQVQWYMDLLGGSSMELVFKPRISSALPDAVEQFKKQWGMSLCAMMLLGVSPDDLSRPLANLTGDQVAKFTEWAFCADSLGLNGQALRDALSLDNVGVS